MQARVVDGVADPPGRRHRPGTQAVRAVLAGVPGCPGEDYPGGGFFHVDTVFLRHLHVLLFIEHGTRRGLLAGITAHPARAWATWQARNLLMNLEDHADGLKFPIRDRDAELTAAIGAVFTAAGMRIIKTRCGRPGERDRRKADRQRPP
jgi:hypothetical protein